MRSQDFYQRHLDAVSRSFALCIPQLTSPFRDRVALAYLLLRVLDTVEDAPFTDRDLQQRQFDAFRQLLRTPATAGDVDRFLAAFPQGLTEAERGLLADTSALLDDAWELPTEAREAMFSAIDRMAQGMAGYAKRSPLRLHDLQDVTRYCCFVAGLVGELLTRLYALGGEPPPQMLSAYRFGLFLQKVNILKDQAEDEAAGRYLVPDRRELLASLGKDAQGALGYVASLPREERGYRTFCAWSLLLGASSPALVDGPLAKRASQRPQTIALLQRAADIVHDDEALKRLFFELLPPLPEVAPRPAPHNPESAERFVRTLAAPLSETELFELGVVGAGRRTASQ